METDRNKPHETKISGDEILEQGSVVDADDVHRRIQRGNESVGDADARDTAGAPPSQETPHGREESKKRRSASEEG